MKYYIKLLECFILFLCISFNVRANHLLGGEIGYTLQSSTTTTQIYRVKLKFFADCGSTSAAFQALVNATPRVAVYKNNILVQSINLVYDATTSDTNITPVCPDMANQTTCTNSSNTIPGVKLYNYYYDYSISDTSSNYKFVFEGSISQTGSVSNAGRTTLIANANVLAGTSLMYLIATLNNTVGANSTSVFNASPTPFFCINTAQTYNLLASDPNGDSLYYELVPANQSLLTNSTYYDITYYTPYTATAPLPTAAGMFSFSNTTGQMDFTPNASVNSVVVNKVSEYRNGVQVGSSMREMAFIFLSNCNNTGPTDSVTNQTQVSVDSNTLVNVCANAGNFSFQLPVTDAEGDNVTVSYANIPSGLTISVANNGTSAPVISFSGNSNNFQPGTYSFNITLQDDGCPLSVTTIKTYNLIIRSSESYTLDTTLCGGTSFQFGDTLLTQTVHNFTKTFENQFGCDSIVTLNLNLTPAAYNLSIIDTACGKYTIGTVNYYNSTEFNDTLKSKLGCDSVYRYVNLTIYPEYPDPVIMDKIGCDSVVFEGKTYINSTVLYDTFTTVHGCDSTKRTVNVIVDHFNLSLFADPDSAYQTQSIHFTTEGNGTFYSINSWSPSLYFPNQNALEQVVGIGDEGLKTISISGTSQYGCYDTASINIFIKHLNTNFGFPNAFSPNGDGVNDVFKPVTSMSDGYTIISFNVYNRYGQNVYSANSGTAPGWNGMQKNSPAPSGTYFYLVEVRYFNGVVSTYKGDVTLIR